MFACMCVCVCEVCMCGVWCVMCVHVCMRVILGECRCDGDTDSRDKNH